MSRLSDQYKEFFNLLQDLEQTKDDEELQEMRQHSFLRLLLLKDTNRNEKYAFRSQRECVQEEKVHVDSIILQLQNLLYEVNYLKREIRNCNRFRSEDENLKLLTSFDYTKFLNDKVADYQPSSDRKGLLESEIVLRKQLAKQCDQLLKDKEDVSKHLSVQEELLASVPSLIRNLKKAATPLQTALNVPVDKHWQIKKSVYLLPLPLYLSFMNVHALTAVYEAQLSVNVLGSIDEARHGSFMNDKSNKRKSKSLDSYEGDTNSNQSNDDHKDLYQAHPLFVQVSIGPETDNEKLKINFRFFPKLGFCTAQTENFLSDTDAELVSATDILKDLFVDDNGSEIPLCDLEYKLTTAGVSSEDCIKHLVDNNLGRPYKWLQYICGIENYEEENKKSIPIRKHTESILTKVKSLWESRLKLLKEIRTLANKNVELFLGEDRTSTPKPSCSLVQWSCITWEEYVANQHTSFYINLGAAKANHSFYRSVIVRGSAKMECFISVSAEFPADSPIWVVRIYWNGEHNSTNNTAVKALEYWTNNMNVNELEDGEFLMQAQLKRTMYSFDIFLETEAPLYSPFEYSKEKHFIKPFSKRSRSRPYKLSAGGLFCSLK